ncbi:MAG: DUF3365 domain-containing protein [Chthonomonadales bacterium]|nr:DUF3365 domain-containing protein [Chthonomonadales bacterium]
MSAPGFARALWVRVLTVPIAVFLLGMLVPGAVAYSLLGRLAERESYEKAASVFGVLEAVRQAPAGSRVGGCQAALGAARSQQRSGSEVPFRYRLVSLTAVREDARPDRYEQQLLATFAADPRLRRVQEEVRLNGERTRVVAAPVVAEGAACVRCHGARGGWRPGAVVGASVLYLPAGFTYAQSQRVFRVTVTLVAILCALGAAALARQVHVLVAAPARDLFSASQAIRRGDWSARFPAVGHTELTALAASVQETTRWLRERVAQEEKLRAMFQQFVPASVAARALGRDAEEALAGARHPVTVMAVNVRNFRLLMDHLPPAQTVSTLNEFFSQVNAAIVEHRGIVSKYLGDTVLAIFGMPLGNDGHALDAVRAALAIPRALHDMYLQLDEDHDWQLGVGIGIATGEPIVGYFGSEEHREYAVLGEAVAEAAWLESLSKSVPEEDTIVISERTYREVMSDVHVHDLGEKVTPSGATVHAFVVQGLRTEARTALAS